MFVYVWGAGWGASEAIALRAGTPYISLPIRSLTAGTVCRTIVCFILLASV